jgi:hypothetical protein
MPALSFNRADRSKYALLIAILVAVKIALNLAAMSRFGLQRDELLHLQITWIGDMLKSRPPLPFLPKYLCRFSAAQFSPRAYFPPFVPVVSSG